MINRNFRKYPIRLPGLSGLLLLLQLTAYPVRAQVQEQVPIPGLSLEESVRLETASETLKELTTQRSKKNTVRTDEIEKLVKQVDDAAKQGDLKTYQTALDRYFSYLFKVNNDDHAALSQIVTTVAGTRVLVARARLGIEQMNSQAEDEAAKADEFSNLINEHEEAFQDIFTKPGERVTSNVANLLMIDDLSEEAKARLEAELVGLEQTNMLFEHWSQPLQNVPYLPAQLDPAFDKDKVIAFLDEADYHLKYDYKDLEMQLFWAEVMAKVGKAYANGKLPLVRVHAAFQRMSQFTMDLPSSNGKPWFVDALDRLKHVRPPKGGISAPTFTRTPDSGAGPGGRTAVKKVSTGSPEDILKRIREKRTRNR